MSYPSDIPVVIIGGGPTGLTTALLLAEYGVRSVILERAATPLDIPRAIVLDDEGLRTLQVFGADRAYLGMTVEGDGAEYVDDAGHVFGKVGAGPENYGFPKRSFINQPDMETVLRGYVAKADLCALNFSSEVTALDDHGDNAGLASSLGGTLQMVAGGATIVLTAPFFDATVRPMALAIFLCAAGALALTLLLGRRIART